MRSVIRTFVPSSRARAIILKIFQGFRTNLRRKGSLISPIFTDRPEPRFRAAARSVRGLYSRSCFSASRRSSISCQRAADYEGQSAVVGRAAECGRAAVRALPPESTSPASSPSPCRILARSGPDVARPPRSAGQPAAAPRSATTTCRLHCLTHCRSVVDHGSLPFLPQQRTVLSSRLLIFLGRRRKRRERR